MRQRWLTPVLALVVVVATCLAPAASADVFAPISLASEGPLDGSGLSQQFDYAHDPAISADARYVAFDGSYQGVQGVWRRDLQDGAIEAVTTCATPSQSHPSSCDAELPSISANGRYVSFTTTAALDPVLDTNGSPDVYVRDMSRPEGEQPHENARHELEGGAFALASAVSGSPQGLTYEPPGSPSAVEAAQHGSVAAGRSALSADGRKVAFVTTQISNLAGKGTPALQVAVRDLDSQETQLVSVLANPATGEPELQAGKGRPVSAPEGGFTYGAVYSPGAVPAAFTTYENYAYQMPPRIGASISADGTTVAWMGQDVGMQTRTLAEEVLLAHYAEPLWRRIDEGPAAPIRRVTGGADPSSPACIASGERQPAEPASSADPCEGPFRVRAPDIGAFSEAFSDSVPELSADGHVVAFLASAPTFAEGSDFGASLEGLHADVYVADMRAPTRTQALTQLTQLAGSDESNVATSASVVDFGLSPDGVQVAFVTQRTTFPLSSPAYVSAPAGVPGMAELFDADLANKTLTRVTSGFEGGPSEHPHESKSAGIDPYVYRTDGALSPSFSGDGDALAFSSTASNLVYGDGNTPPLGASGKFDGADAFVVHRVTFPARVPAQEVQSPPSNAPLVPVRRLDVTALSRPDGSVLLYVQAPGAGRVSAVVASTVLVRSRRRTRARARTLIVARSAIVARSTTTVGPDGSVELKVLLAPRYRARADAEGGLNGTVTVAFVASGHTPLRQSLDVAFVRAKTRNGSHARVHRRSLRRTAGARR